MNCKIKKADQLGEDLTSLAVGNQWLAMLVTCPTVVVVSTIWSQIVNLIFKLAVTVKWHFAGQRMSNWFLQSPQEPMPCH